MSVKDGDFLVLDGQRLSKARVEECTSQIVLLEESAQQWWDIGLEGKDECLVLHGNGFRAHNPKIGEEWHFWYDPVTMGIWKMEKVAK